MNKTAFTVSLAALCAAAPFAATADDDILPAEKQNGYGIVDFWYSQFDKHDLDLDGGGYRIGGEVVDPSLLVGIGGRFGMGLYFGGKENRGGTTVEDPVAIDFMLDAYVPFRVSEFVTLYGGVGATGFTESWKQKRSVRSGRWVYTATDDWESDGFPVLFAAFAGIRLRYENVFAFAEYRNDFKKDVDYEVTINGGRTDTVSREMGCGRVFVGLGVEFGK